MPTFWFASSDDPKSEGPQSDDPWADFSDDSPDDRQYRAEPVAPPGGYEDPGIGVDAALDAFAMPEELTPVDPADVARQHVTAILVAHNGVKWLPTVLQSLAQSIRPPDRIVAVDTGSNDATPQLLIDALGASAVVRTRSRTGFGAAVAAGVKLADGSGSRATQRASTRVGARVADDAHPERSARSRRRRRPHDAGGAEPAEWLWILHDDCEPDPDALLRLLECAIRRPDAALIGPKVLGWRDRRQLLEVGLTMTRGGRRETGLEKREFDQGQHDQTREVLAVGSAGMLVRREVWDELRGFDKNLPIFRDDLDFGWRANLAGHDVVACPAAVVHHMEAAAHGRRRIRALRGRPHLIDRRHSLYVLLVNVSLLALPLVLARAVLGSFLRAIGFLFGKLPALAVEELAALLAVLVRPDRLIRGRLARRRIRKVSDKEIRHLFPPPGQQLRQGAESIYAVLSGASSGHDLPGHRRHAADPTGEGGDDEGDGGDSVVRRVSTNPAALLAVGLILVTLIAVRSLFGEGRLMGGALLPAPGSAGVLWDSYVTSWHGVGLGSPTASPPYLAVVSAFGSILGGNASLAVTLLLIGSVPLAGLTAYAALRRVIHSVWARTWAAAVYGLLPATTGAIAAGRLGTAVAIVLTPVTMLAIARTMGGRLAPGLLRGAWTAGLLLALTAAFVPLAWVAALLMGIVGLAAFYRDRARAVRLLIILGLTPLLFVPWTAQVLNQPKLLFAEAGVPGPGLSDAQLPPWAVLLLHPGGPGAAPVWLGIGVVLAGYAVLARRDRWPLTLTGWTVALVGLVLGVAVSRTAITAPTVQTPVAGWPGYATALVALGLLIAAAAGADGLRARLRSGRTGLPKRAVAGILATAALATPLVAAGWWMWRGADDPLDRRNPDVLPAYVVEEAHRSARVRTLVIRPTGDGPVGYALLRSGGPRLGDAETGPDASVATPLDAMVGDIVSGRGGAEAADLAAFGIGFVYLPAPADSDVAGALDGVPGLQRGSAPAGAAIWQVDAPVSRLRIVPPSAEDGGTTGEVVPLPSGSVTADTGIPAGEAGRTLVLAEHADPGWEASLDGQSLPSVEVDGWAQGFTLPAEAGELRLTHQGPERARWLLFQLVVVGLAILFALPGMRRDPDAIDAVAEFDSDETGEAPVPAVSKRVRRPSRRRQTTSAATDPGPAVGDWAAQTGSAAGAAAHAAQRAAAASQFAAASSRVAARETAGQPGAFGAGQAAGDAVAGPPDSPGRSERKRGTARKETPEPEETADTTMTWFMPEGSLDDLDEPTDESLGTGTGSGTADGFTSGAGPSVPTAAPATSGAPGTFGSEPADYSSRPEDATDPGASSGGRRARGRAKGGRRAKGRSAGAGGGADRGRAGDAGHPTDGGGTHGEGY